MASDIFESLMRETLEDFSIGNEGQFSGYCHSEEEIEGLLTNLKCVGYYYSVRRSAHYQNCTDAARNYPGFFFQLMKGCVTVRFFGSPFSVESVSQRECIFGPKYCEKKEIPVPDHLADHVFLKRKRNCVKGTRRSGCPARFSVKCIRVYPGYKIKSERECNGIKKKVFDRLKEDLLSPDKPTSFLRFYVVASPPGHHTHSTETVKAAGDIHPLLAKEIMNIVKTGITSVKVVKVQLEAFVNKYFTGSIRPDCNNTTFYPTDTIIYNHVYKTLKTRKTVFDQDAQPNDQDAQSNQIKCEVISEDAKINFRHNNSETSNSCSSLDEQAREICKQIINLTYNCNDETLEKVVEDLKNIRHSLELCPSADNALS